MVRGHEIYSAPPNDVVNLSPRVLRKIPKNGRAVIEKKITDLQSNSGFDVNSYELAEREIIYAIDKVAYASIGKLSNSFIATCLETRSEELILARSSDVAEKIIDVADALRDIAKPRPKGMMH